MMSKKILSIILSVLLIMSASGFSAGAAPSVAENYDTVTEYSSDAPAAESDEAAEDEAEYGETAVNTAGPAPVLMADSAHELNTEFGTPEAFEGAALMAELSGDGTEQSPYLIGTADELKLLSSNINSAIGYDAHYRLTADIDLGGAEWTPIGYYSELHKDTVAFCGVFDGAGHTVSNFKITKDSVAYVGFFGRVVGGTIRNLNIDNATIKVTSSMAQKLYVGILAGRITTTSPSTHAVVEYCNVTNSSINYSGYGTVYAGGLAGSVISDAYADTSVLVGFSSVECDITVATLANNPDGNQPHAVSAGGLVGYLHALTDSTITVTNCSTNSNVYANTLKTVVARPLCGGAFGNIRTITTNDSNKIVGEGTIKISSCHSSGTVLAESDFYNYIAGGFAAQIYSLKKIYVSDCYSSSLVNGNFLKVGQGCENDPTIGGFAGQIYVLSYTDKLIENCYASGDVIDLSDVDNAPVTADDYDLIYAGAFTGYFMVVGSEDTFLNCYRLSTQTVDGTDICEGDYTGIVELSAEQALLSESYVGFDMQSIWKMDAEADYPYPYPTLRDKSIYVKFISDDLLYEVSTPTSDLKAVKPSKAPSKASTIDKVFVFNYWSLEKDGEPFDFENAVITENTFLYAVFSTLTRTYTVSFKSNGTTFETKKLGYGSAITAPETNPEKASTKTHDFSFLYWSDTEDGEKFDFTDSTVVGNKTFYAVFEAIDKTAWDGAVAEGFAGGYGTEAMPYIIETGEELALFAKVINDKTEGFADAHYALGANIHLGKKQWVPVGISADAPFSGSFDGCGYTISSFALSENQYAGLFGYILNGTVKNLDVRNFTIDLAPSEALPYSNMYVGPVAGYVSARNGGSVISAVCVSEGTININGSIERLYAGGITGFGEALSMGYTTIKDSYALVDITALNSTGYNYLGGIVGRFNTGSGGLSQILHCYTMGTLDSECPHSSHAGGLVGYLYSDGSAYGASTLLDDDEDIMIKDSFAITSVYSLSTKYTSYAGRITGEHNLHAGVENVFVPRSAGIVIQAEAVSTTMAVSEDSTGATTDKANLMSLTYLSGSRGFDFENTWTFISDYDYPVLKCVVDDKPDLTVIEAILSDGTLEVTLGIMSNADSATLIIGIYNSRSQLIKLERMSIEKSDYQEMFTLTYEGMNEASYVTASAYDSATLSPLFTPAKSEI